MIEGFKIKMTSAELKKQLETRAAYHEKRAMTKQEQLPKLQAVLDALKAGGAGEVANIPTTSNYRVDREDELKRLEADIKAHRDKALVFKFFASHLFDEDYVLNEDDLVRLEVLRF